MKRDLTNSPGVRQHILENPEYVARIRAALSMDCSDGYNCFPMNGNIVSVYYRVGSDVLERCIADNLYELHANGMSGTGDSLSDVMFDFRSFLNVGMLLDSEKAKDFRSLLLDVVIAAVNEKTGGGTVYVSHRKGRRLDEDCKVLFERILEDNKDVLLRLK